MASLQLCVSSPNPPTIALKTIMQMPANPAIFPGTGEGLLVEAIIVLQSCGKTSRFFFFFPWCRQSAFIKATTTICVRSKNTHTQTHVMKRHGRVLSAYYQVKDANVKRLYTVCIQGHGWQSGGLCMCPCV